MGNAGGVRSVGDLYGIILLPAAATGADIEAARKLLIDRGAADGTTSSAYSSAWYQRNDIVEFKNIDFTGATNLQSAWQDSTSLTSFSVALLPDATDVSYAWRYAHLTSFNTAIPLVTNAQFAWFNCNLMDSFGTTEIPNCTNFTSSWQNCSALTSFPSGAKLGTEATNVNFTSAWQSSGLTSFPALDLSNGINMSYAFYNATSLSSFGAIDARVCTNFFNAFNGCSALTSFPAGAKLGTEAINVNFNLAWMSSGLTSFPAALDLSKGSRFIRTWKLTPLASFSTKLPKSANCLEAWQGCSSLVDFSADVFTNWNPASIDTAVFNDTWDGCSALSAQSVENILVSIDASGKYATTNGASGGSALADAGIDIDYNTATGTPAYSTLASLKAKGWSIIVNNVTL